MNATRTVCLNGLVCRAFIGVYEYERTKGGDFLVDIEIEMDASVREEAVELIDTINYEAALAIVNEIMAQPEFLLETVANRIVLRCRDAFPQAVAMAVHIQKKNPPLQAEVDSSSVKLVVKF